MVKEEEDIIMLQFTRKSQNGNCLLGLEFTDPKFRGDFETRLRNMKYEYVIVDSNSIMFPLIAK